METQMDSNTRGIRDKDLHSMLTKTKTSKIQGLIIRTGICLYMMWIETIKTFLEKEEPVWLEFSRMREEYRKVPSLSRMEQLTMGSG
jgi:hypothetical protein